MFWSASPSARRYPARFEAALDFCRSFAASKGGAPSHPGWYHNLVKNRDAEIEVGTDKFKVRATPIAKGPERDRLYKAHGDNFAAFRDYPSKTTRIIPVVVLERVS